MIMIPMYSELSSPIYYENELRAYEHEIEVCPDSLVTPEYALERRYKVWRYEQLLQKARENSELNPYIVCFSILFITLIRNKLFLLK